MAGVPVGDLAMKEEANDGDGKMAQAVVGTPVGSSIIKEEADGKHRLMA